MGNLTYEEKTLSVPLETYEWDNVWYEHTNNEEAERLVYIGDSISVGTRGWIKTLSDNKIMGDGFATSKALDNPYFKPLLELFLAQEKRIDGILFNNGLHGWHLSLAEYEKYYEEMLEFLLQKGKPLYVILTINLPADAERDKIVCARNEIALSLAKKHGIPTVDLYSLSKAHTDLYTADNVHLSAEGYELLAQCILDNIG